MYVTRYLQSSGQAVDAAIELSDYLTQYSAGRNQFTGHVPSEIANRVLDGDQAVRVQNRRFAADSPIRMFIADEIPDATPSTLAGAVICRAPARVEGVASGISSAMNIRIGESAANLLF